MNQLNTIKAIGYGAFLWLIITALVGSVYGLGLYFDMIDSVWPEIIAALVAGGIALIFAKEAGIISHRQALTYSLLWLFIPIILDLLIIARLTDAVFSSWQYWFGHILVLLSPWLVLWGGQKKETTL